MITATRTPATIDAIANAKDARTSLRVYWAMEVAAEAEKPRGVAAAQ